MPVKKILKKILIKLCRICGYEIIDQSQFSFPSLKNKKFNNLSTINNKSIVFPLGEVKISKKVQSLPTHTLRFWEKEFKQIKPKIFSGNRRYYDENSINTLKKIKFLLKDKGMTLNGVKKLLNSEESDIDELNYTSIRQKNIIKKKLKYIKNLIKNIKVNNG